MQSAVPCRAVPYRRCCCHYSAEQLMTALLTPDKLGLAVLAAVAAAATVTWSTSGGGGGSETKRKGCRRDSLCKCATV